MVTPSDYRQSWTAIRSGSPTRSHSGHSISVVGGRSAASSSRSASAVVRLSAVLLSVVDCVVSIGLPLWKPSLGAGTTGAFQTPESGCDFLPIRMYSGFLVPSDAEIRGSRGDGSGCISLTKFWKVLRRKFGDLVSEN